MFWIWKNLKLSHSGIVRIIWQKKASLVTDQCTCFKLLSFFFSTRLENLLAQGHSTMTAATEDGPGMTYSKFLTLTTWPLQIPGKGRQRNVWDIYHQLEEETQQENDWQKKDAAPPVMLSIVHLKNHWLHFNSLSDMQTHYDAFGFIVLVFFATFNKLSVISGYFLGK